MSPRQKVHVVLTTTIKSRMKSSIVPKSSVTLIISTLFIFSQFHPGGECQQQGSITTGGEIISTSSSVNEEDQKVGKSYVPTSNPWANQQSYNYNPNYYTSQNEDPQMSTFNLTHYNYPQLSEWGSSVSPYNNKKNNYQANYVSSPQNYYGYYGKSQSTQLAVLPTHPPPLPPSRVQKQMNMDQLKQLRRIENHEAHAMGHEWGRSIGETVMSNFLFPVTFFAFSMIFLDIMGRLVPVKVPNIRSVFGGPTTTTTTPPPPKITKIEIQPPPFPNIGDIIAEQVAGLKRLKAVKKAGHDKHTDSEEYYGWTAKRRRLPMKRSKKKKRGKKKGEMTWSKLQKLYQTYKPEVLKK